MRPLHAGQKAHLCYSLTFTPSPAIFGDKHPQMLHTSTQKKRRDAQINTPLLHATVVVF